MSFAGWTTVEAGQAANLIERHSGRVEVYAARAAIWQPVTARKHARSVRESGEPRAIRFTDDGKLKVRRPAGYSPESQDPPNL